MAKVNGSSGWHRSSEPKLPCYTTGIYDLETGELKPQFADLLAKFAVPEGSTLAGAARTDDPPTVPMSGGQGPAGAAKHSDPRFPGASYCPRCGLFAYPVHKCIGATPP